MMRALWFLPVSLGAWAAGAALDAQRPREVLLTLTPGVTIDRSVTIRRGAYRLPAAGTVEGAAIRITGSNIVVDFNGAEIVGTGDRTRPDLFTGTGIVVDGGSDITIRNVSVRGYKVALLGRRSPRLHVTASDFSYNWRPRLASGIEKESLADWLSYHDNEKDEWLRYGAAIYLDDCDHAEIDGVTARQGQNGLLAADSDRMRIWNNDFSFLSGLGIGLYRSNDNRVLHNRVDWCIRGYSHGFYNRGQDSAGILMYEQSSRNIVAYNSVTHGGDGLFLWAGKTTMDTGQGGANDNLFYGNDFSHAATNGMEATFSRNRFIANRVEECWHGLWGGYSFESEIVGNRFARNTEAIAIEHGQQNTIAHNTFDKDETAIRLWWNPIQDPSWGYPKYRNTRSERYGIHDNAFAGHDTALKVDRTQQVSIHQNAFGDVKQVLVATGDTAGLSVTSNNVRVSQPPAEAGVDLLDATANYVAPVPGAPVPDGLLRITRPYAVSSVRDGAEAARIAAQYAPPRMKDGVNAMLAAGARRGREHIIVDEWGPFDYRSPKLWPKGRSDANPLVLRVLGPPGRWEVVSHRGAAAVSADRGVIPGEIEVRLPSDPLVDLDLQLRYIGGEVVTPFGERGRAKTPFPFAYRRFSAPTDWRVRYFVFDAATDPTAEGAFARVAAGTPVREDRLPRLDLLTSRALAEGLPNDRVAIVAEARVDLPPGSYAIRTISDDGVRVWVDDRLAIDRWSIHESALDEAPLGGGPHRLRVEYFEATGWSELRVDVVRR